jgi:2'-5' RNA ligase
VDRLRLFIAVDTPGEVKQSLAILADDMSRAAKGVRWEPSVKFHCTLRFLGDVDRSRLVSLEEEVRSASAVPPLSVAYSGIGFFPAGARPRVVWAGISDTHGDLRRLQERISAGLTRLGFPREERPFHPHVTLGRVREGADVRGLIDIVKTRTFVHPPVIVPAVEIMQSVPGPRGSVYAVLRSIPLSGTRGDTPDPS